VTLTRTDGGAAGYAWILTYVTTCYIIRGTMNRQQKKVRVGYLITADSRDLLTKLHELLGVSRTAIVEMAIREFAKRYGVE
jgi:hypothetical protein